MSPETGECHYQAEVYRLRGAVLAETGEAAEGASWLQRAIDTARSQQANLWSCAPRPASRAAVSTQRPSRAFHPEVIGPSEICNFTFFAIWRDYRFCGGGLHLGSVLRSDAIRF
jgi:hypothetical protein